MRKTILLVSGLLFSVSTQAQILDIIKSTVKNQTGVDLNNPKTILKQSLQIRQQQLSKRRQKALHQSI